MKSIIKGAGYILVHTPDMVIHNGTTQTTERVVNPESEYLKELPEHIRSFEDTLSYYPNQVYIGNVTPDALAAVPQPWHDKKCPETKAVTVSSARSCRRRSSCFSCRPAMCLTL